MTWNWTWTSATYYPKLTMSTKSIEDGAAPVEKNTNDFEDGELNQLAKDHGVSAIYEAKSHLSAFSFSFHTESILTIGE